MVRVYSEVRGSPRDEPSAGLCDVMHVGCRGHGSAVTAVQLSAALLEMTHRKAEENQAQIPLHTDILHIEIKHMLIFNKVPALLMMLESLTIHTRYTSEHT